jgi:hypothetical protein
VLGSTACAFIALSLISATYGLVTIPNFSNIIFNELNAKIGRTEVVSFNSKPISASVANGIIHRTQTCIEAPAGVSFDQDTAVVNVNADGVDGSGGKLADSARQFVHSEITVKTPSRICWEISVNPPAADWDIRGDAYVSVNMTQPVGNRLPITQGTLLPL